MDQKVESCTDDALDVLFSALKGPNALSLLQIAEESVFLRFIHRETRELAIWVNEQNQVIFVLEKNH